VLGPSVAHTSFIAVIDTLTGTAQFGIVRATPRTKRLSTQERCHAADISVSTLCGADCGLVRGRVCSVVVSAVSVSRPRATPAVSSFDYTVIINTSCSKQQLSSSTTITMAASLSPLEFLFQISNGNISNDEKIQRCGLSLKLHAGKQSE